MTPGQRRLYYYSWFLVAAVTGLIFVGAMVTSKNAGLAVPDWPLSFGSVNPPQFFTEEPVFWEHSHRLIGATTGLITLGLFIWTWIVYIDSRLKWFALALFLLVFGQGIMGGLRVIEKSTAWAIVHGCTAQAIYSLVVIFMVVASPRKPQPQLDVNTAGYVSLRWASVALAGVVFLQLIIGAVMRHLHAGLAVLGFPLSNGRWIPEFTNHGVIIHFTHRVWAVMVLLMTMHCLIVTLKRFGSVPTLKRPMLLIAGLVVLQVVLGATTVLTYRSPLWTSLHVLNGAAILASSVYFAVVVRLMGRNTQQAAVPSIPAAPTPEAA